MKLEILQGDCLDILKTLPDESVNCCVTSPPYWGLRDYGCAGQLGLERTPELYVAKMVEVFREVRRVLRNDGTLWLNLGDSYAGWGGGNNPAVNCKPKDLVGVPWLMAFALRTDGWYLRSDIIWSKPNPMPESVTDRPTKAHEYIFLMSKSARYYYDAESIKEESSYGSEGGCASWRGERTVPDETRQRTDKQRGHSRRHAGFNDRWDAMERAEQCTGFRNKRSVWNIGTHPYPDAHFATFPPDLIEPCIKAGCPEGGTVLDPFSGAGTTGLVSSRFNRNYIGIELNPAYVEMSKKRIEQDAPMFNKFESAKDSVVATQENLL